MYTQSWELGRPSFWMLKYTLSDLLLQVNCLKLRLLSWESRGLIHSLTSLYFLKKILLLYLRTEFISLYGCEEANILRINKWTFSKQSTIKTSTVLDTLLDGWRESIILVRSLWINKHLGRAHEIDHAGEKEHMRIHANRILGLELKQHFGKIVWFFAKEGTNISRVLIKFSEPVLLVVERFHRQNPVEEVGSENATCYENVSSSSFVWSAYPM